jgi:hypothetical protein
MKSLIQIYDRCGCIGSEMPKQPITHEEPLLPTGVFKKYVGITNNELKRIQEKADRLGILMPIEYNRKIDE